MNNNNIKELKTQLHFLFIDEIEFRIQLIWLVNKSKKLRYQPQRELAETLNISLTKIKEIENGTAKDFNAINNYINFFQNGFNFKLPY